MEVFGIMLVVDIYDGVHFCSSCHFDGIHTTVEALKLVSNLCPILDAGKNVRRLSPDDVAINAFSSFVGSHFYERDKPLYYDKYVNNGTFYPMSSYAGQIFTIKRNMDMTGALYCKINFVEEEVDLTGLYQAHGGFNKGTEINNFCSEISNKLSEGFFGMLLSKMEINYISDLIHDDLHRRIGGSITTCYKGLTNRVICKDFKAVANLADILMCKASMGSFFVDDVVYTRIG